MPKLYRDVATFAVDFSSNVNSWLYRGLFQYPNGSIESKLVIRGIDEMKRTLKKLENGTIKVVRRKQYSSLEYEPCVTREREVKEMLRKEIEELENDYSYYEELSTLICISNGEMLQH